MAHASWGMGICMSQASSPRAKQSQRLVARNPLCMIHERHATPMFWAHSVIHGDHIEINRDRPRATRTHKAQLARAVHANVLLVAPSVQRVARRKRGTAPIL
eukprot:107689-Prymnesium_polylepis.1